MCTVTWLQEPGSCLLFFNRDELRTRLPGLPPEIKSQGGVSYISPSDANYGGTWLFVNAFGLITCLLNYYPDPLPPEPEKTISRGLLVHSCVTYFDPAAVGDFIENTELSTYRPFTLLALKPDALVQQWQWDGRCLSCSGGEMVYPPLTSSSYRSAEVEAVRRQTYHDALIKAQLELPTAAFLEGYHYQHWPERPAHSVCMSREDAATESINRIKVDPNNTCFRYTTRNSDSLQFTETVDLVLTRQSSST